MNAAAVKRIEDVQRLRAAQYPEDAGPLAHPIQPQSYVEINNFYTATVYEKGAEVIRMIHTLLGPEKFRKGTDLYFDRHDGQAVTTEEFIAALEDGSGTDLTQFRRWYIQPGTPEISATAVYDADMKRYTLTLTQKNKKAGENTDPLHIPVAVGLLGQSGDDLLDDRTRLLNFTEKSQSFTFDNITEEPTPSLFRNFSAPIKLTKSPADEKMELLFKKDSDPFNRWEAGQRLASRILLDQIRDYGSEKASNTPPEIFMDAFGELLTEDNLDPAFRAAAMALPGESYIGQQMATVDVDAIHHCRKTTLRALGERFEADFKRLYDENSTKDNAGHRALKNIALVYLCGTKKQDYITLASEQYNQAINMTDRVDALVKLVTTSGPERKAALEDYYSRWENDALVIDKWFSLQAMSSRPQAMEDVQTLLKHDAFSMLNPNRVRSLVGAFASGNPIHFHAKSGRGYSFLSERILELNKTNPQIAARFVSPLGQWRRYDEERQELMKAELTKILNEPNLSSHVYEMVNKSLNNN